MSRSGKIEQVEGSVRSAHFHDVEGNRPASTAISEGVIKEAAGNLAAQDALETDEVSAWRQLMSKAMGVVKAVQAFNSDATVTSEAGSVNAAISEQDEFESVKDPRKHRRQTEGLEAMLTGSEARHREMSESPVLELFLEG